MHFIIFYNPFHPSYITDICSGVAINEDEVCNVLGLMP